MCAAAAGAMAMTMQQHFPLSRLAHGNKKKRKEKEKKTIVTRASQVVPHPSTDRARPCLTSLFRWEAVTHGDMAACDKRCAQEVYEPKRRRERIEKERERERRERKKRERKRGNVWEVFLVWRMLRCLK